MEPSPKFNSASDATGHINSLSTRIRQVTHPTHSCNDVLVKGSTAESVGVHIFLEPEPPNVSISRCTISSSLWCIVRLDLHCYGERPLSLAYLAASAKAGEQRQRSHRGDFLRIVHLAKPGQISSPLFLVVSRRGPIKRTAYYICTAQSV